MLPLQLQNGSVAQLYRASDSGSEGHGLESHRGHLYLNQIHINQEFIWICYFTNKLLLKELIFFKLKNHKTFL